MKNKNINTSVKLNVPLSYIHPNKSKLALQQQGLGYNDLKREIAYDPNFADDS